MKAIIAAMFLMIQAIAFAQADTTYSEEEDTIQWEDINFEEYFHVKKGVAYTYPQKGTNIDDVLDTIALHIRKGGLFTTNLDVNYNIGKLAAERRRNALEEAGSPDTARAAIPDEIGNSRSEESIGLFLYYASDSIKHDFVVRKFDQVETCECSKSIFEQITEYKEITYAMESPKLKWMTFTYFQHGDESLYDEYIFIEYKMRWKLLSRNFTIILKGGDPE